MTQRKSDHRFKRRYILRTVLLLVPPLIAGALIWRDGGLSGPAFWPAACFFVAWIAGWILLDAALFRAYRCPSCGRRITQPTIPDRNAGDPIRYYCPTCRSEWDTGLREASD